jgi:hypothetical protein
VNRILQVQMVSDGLQIVGIVVEVVPSATCVERPWPRRSCAITR